ncbi:DNA-directed RNA polymerase subunit D [Candidatus Woesearchaeota archaeon CG10_big_fil_rev_8_21_14_0_10_32_24]|nr:MAG: DNA-directed RNA polymerase subunit D [Candidatus Woesearchaeota archaeon CG10_big_fil_rev_8_21_14_0_10_32_24]
MKLEKLQDKKKDGKLTFLMKGTNEVFANTVRRLILDEVPTLAVEDVEIKENSSALFDEMLALRLGLLPIKTDLKSYRLPENEAEIAEKSARCTLQIKLKSSKKGDVLAGEAESSDPKCTFVHEEMPVVRLLAKQKLDVTMTAVMGQGKEHVKWAPGWAFYRKVADIKVGKVDVEALAKINKDGVFKISAGKVTVDQEKVYQSYLLEQYDNLEGIDITYSDDIIFNLESWGQLSCKEILAEAADILINKVEEMEKLI